MNKGITISLTVFAVVLFYSCGPLEGSEVIGLGGGFVFYDKGNYNNGWRYLESAPKNAGELPAISGATIDFNKAQELADAFSYGGYNDWRLPTDDEYERMAKFFLNQNALVNDSPPDRGGLKFRNNIFYLTGDGHAYYCKTVITTNSEGKRKWNSEILQGSGMYESDFEYIVHPIRQF